MCTAICQKPRWEHWLKSKCSSLHWILMLIHARISSLYGSFTSLLETGHQKRRRNMIGMNDSRYGVLTETVWSLNSFFRLIPTERLLLDLITSIHTLFSRTVRSIILRMPCAAVRWDVHMMTFSILRQHSIGDTQTTAGSLRSSITAMQEEDLHGTDGSEVCGIII